MVSGRLETDMNHSMRSRKSSMSRRGVAIVEFAVVAPVVFLVVFGLIEMGRMVMIKQAVVNAAREGCRKAILASTRDVNAVTGNDGRAVTDSVVRARLLNVVPDASDLNELRVTCYLPPVFPFTTEANLDPPQPLPSGTVISVTVECDFSWVSWTPGNFVGFDNAMTISATSTKQRE